MKKFVSILKDKFLFTKSTTDISSALVGYNQMEKAHIVDLYNCYGIDAVIKYLN